MTHLTVGWYIYSHIAIFVRSVVRTPTHTHFLRMDPCCPDPSGFSSLWGQLPPPLQHCTAAQVGLDHYQDLAFCLIWEDAVTTPPFLPSHLFFTLSSLSLFRIHEMERRLDTPLKFLHPCYEALTWFAARNLLRELKGTCRDFFNL